MYFKCTVLFMIVCLTISNVSSQAARCYDVDCPPLTERCRKVMKTSPDKLYVQTTISCLDSGDYSLREHFSESPNILGRHTNYESTSYQSIDSEPLSYRQPPYNNRLEYYYE